MPLEPGKAAIGGNIKREEAAGKPPAQAKAIALATARKTGANIPKPGRDGSVVVAGQSRGGKL